LPRYIPLLEWLNAHQTQFKENPVPDSAASEIPTSAEEKVIASVSAKPVIDDGIKFGRRAEDKQNGPHSLKVDQAKIDRLMNLIGELVVEKNSLPYLAQRAETQYGVRELSREIKGGYSVINRIADEMQDAIMQVRMMAVSIVFQRFPRMVRDISHKLGKDVQLVIEGKETELDRSVLEEVGDPLGHLVRNAMDHGIESPDERRAAGKPQPGTVRLTARHADGRILITVEDDGRGMDPAALRRAVVEKGLMTRDAADSTPDAEMLRVIFMPGFSTAKW